MPIRFRRRVRLHPDGTLEINLHDSERDLLRSVAAELTDDLTSSSDPSLQRLFPPGYGSDPVRDAGYQMMMGDELRQRHLGALRVLAATSGTERLDAGQAEAWIQSINAIRLVLGTRLGIEADTEPVRVSRNDPNLASWVAYDFLSLLLNDLIEAMAP